YIYTLSLPDALPILLGDLNGRVPAGPTAGRPKIDSDIDACEMILMLAPETNGEVAVKAWEALGKMTGRDHVHLAEGKEEEKIRRSEEHTSELQSREK